MKLWHQNECPFAPQLLPARHSGTQQKMTKCLDCLPPVWKSCMEFQAPGLRMPRPGYYSHSEDDPARGRALSFYLSKKSALLKIIIYAYFNTPRMHGIQKRLIAFPQSFWDVLLLGWELTMGLPSPFSKMKGENIFGTLRSSTFCFFFLFGWYQLRMN